VIVHGSMGRSRASSCLYFRAQRNGPLAGQTVGGDDARREGARVEKGGAVAGRGGEAESPGLEA
jgi:hypothetical protein